MDNTLKDLKKDAKFVRKEIATLVGDLLDAYPGTKIDYGSIWTRKIKGKRKVRVRLDIKV